MKPLIDADILLYEIGFASQKTTIVAGETIVEPQSWEFCQEVFDNRVKLICGEVEATEEPLLFLTNTKYINHLLNKKRKWQNEEIVEYIHNFREIVAKEREYKGTRKPDKPFHYKNLINHILLNYSYHIAENGLEADDAMCIYQMSWPRSDIQTIICSRDKDVRQCLGWHYSWECGKQASIGPLLVNDIGYLKNSNEGKFHPKTGKSLPLKVFGVGPKFFYYQMLTGDTVDNVIGVMGRGPAFAYNLLKDVETEWDCYQFVAEVYVKTWGDEWETKMREQADLLWIIKEADEKGPIRWTKPLLNTL